MFRKFSFAVLAVLLVVSGVRANEELTAADLDVASISDVDNQVVEAGLDVDVDTLANKKDGEVDRAIEAGFYGHGGHGGYCNSYSYGYNYHCYSPVYSYSYCYTPVYYTYRPVCYTTYTHCYAPTYSLSYWGCY